MSDDYENKSFVLRTAADTAEADQRFARAMDELREMYAKKSGSFIMFTFDPDAEEVTLGEYIMIGGIHPLAGAFFFASVLASIVEAADKWAEVMAQDTEEHGGDEETD